MPTLERESRHVPPRLIGMVHLLPLPGAPLFRGSVMEVVDAAMDDARAIAEGGMDAIMVENFGDLPFMRGRVAPETVAAMTRAIIAIRGEVGLPMGVNVLRNDAIAALGIAAAVDARFIRVNVHVGAVVADQGIIQGEARDTIERRRMLGVDVAVYADIHVKHAHPLAPRTIEEEGADAVERGMADCVIVSGQRTGAPCNPDDLRRVRDHVRAPVLAGSGVTDTTVRELLRLCDGAIVGSWLKREGRVDRERVERLVESARP